MLIFVLPFLIYVWVIIQPVFDANMSSHQCTQDYVIEMMEWDLKYTWPILPSDHKADKVVIFRSAMV